MQAEGQALQNAPDLWRSVWAAPPAAAHKYQRGHVVVLGGARMVGAARLSARAAGRIGAGLTTLAVPASVWPVYAAQASSVMVHPLPDADDRALVMGWASWLASSRWAALVLGPGAMAGLPESPAATLRGLVTSALSSAGEQALVLDADALTVFERDPELLFKSVRTSRHPVVMTPHEGEFDRLFGPSAADKLTRTREAAQRSGAVVLHKGPDTVIASPDGQTVVNAGAPVWLATAGSGDVLSGLIAGLLAQGLPPFQAACAAAWVHTACGRAFGPGLVADDLPEEVPAVLRSLGFG